MKKTTLTYVSMGLVASCLTSSAANFAMTGGNIRIGDNWQNTDDASTGTLPGVGDTAVIAVDGTMNSLFNGDLSGATITQNAGLMTAAGFNWNNAIASSSYTLAGGAITASNNFNIQSTTFNFTGGTFSFNAQLLSNNAAGTFNISGNAVLSSTGATGFDLRLNADNSTFDIASDWTGSFTSAEDATEADWISQLVYGAGIIESGTAAQQNNARLISVGGTDITDANFGDFFVVTPDGSGGSSLTLVPEPSSTALLGLGGLALILRRRK
ncbi:hypothetical protein NT6N_30220 [Oceaniferula spumae]|uniref:Ice-binding protein C-terminal domain-containing protein n=1 Tax=Oceaniferula spumae TaxID=2979115 RepID=A0AAT9FQ10_9BACT